MLSLQTGSWLRFLAGSESADVRLFCFHHAGGSAASFRDIARALPRGVSIACIQLPGRERRVNEPPLTRLREITSILVDELRPWVNVPYVLLGHSLGATLAFEVTRACETAAGRLRGPSGLIVSGQRPLHVSALGRVAESPALRSELSEAELVAALRSYSGTPDEILDSPAMLRPFLDTIRADLRLAESYRHERGTRVDCPMLVLGGKSDPLVPHGELPLWQALTRATMTLRLFEGGHFFIKESAAHVACVISDFLQRLAPGDPDRCLFK